MKSSNMNTERIEYIPVRMVVHEIKLARTILSNSGTPQGSIVDYDYQEEEDC